MADDISLLCCMKAIRAKAESLLRVLEQVDAVPSPSFPDAQRHDLPASHRFVSDQCTIIGFSHITTLLYVLWHTTQNITPPQKVYAKRLSTKYAACQLSTAEMPLLACLCWPTNVFHALHKERNPCTLSRRLCVLLRFMQHDYVECVVKVISIVNSYKMCLCNDITTSLSPRPKSCQLKWLLMLLSTKGSGKQHGFCFSKCGESCMYLLLDVHKCFAGGLLIGLARTAVKHDCHAHLCAGLHFHAQITDWRMLPAHAMTTMTRLSTPTQKLAVWELQNPGQLYSQCADA